MFAEVVLPVPVDHPFHYAIPLELAPVVSLGLRVDVPFGARTMVGYVSGVTATAPVKEAKNILRAVDTVPVVTPLMFELARWMSHSYACSLGEALATIAPSGIRPPRRMVKPKTPAEIVSSKIPLIQRPSLTTLQRDVITPLARAIGSKQFKSFVLHGVTGSGKTEVYLAALEEALAQGRSGVYLLPEISLTPQFVSIVQSRFPNKVGVWHSKLTPSQRYRTWNAARQGEIQIMLGARSAIFAPFKHIGFIVVDEEHEPSYKQEQKPAYHTRSVAAKVAELHGAAVVFGSATPSLESYHAAIQGSYELLQMPHRIDNQLLPPVRLIDCNLIPIKYRVITKPLKEAIARTLARREQTIIFLNRRGFSPAISCPQCGKTWECPQCSISLVFHKVSNDLRCHYCGYRHEWPSICPSCGNRSLSVFGVGTQKVEEELKQFFPQARIFRLDRDSAADKDTYVKAYTDFKNEQYDILLGTQMVTKGFDFPRVTLVGVIDADTALHLPDFRASERTFQLLTQVAGRAGRSALRSEVIIQTRYPQHYALQAARDHNYQEFFDQEIQLRSSLNYPPFSRLVSIMVRAVKEERALEHAQRIHADILAHKSQHGFKFEVFGPTPAAHAKVRRMFRWQILLKGADAEVISAAHHIREYFLPRGVFFTIDVDPYAVL